MVFSYSTKGWILPKKAIRENTPFSKETWLSISEMRRQTLDSWFDFLLDERLIFIYLENLLMMNEIEDLFVLVKQLLTHEQWLEGSSLPGWEGWYSFNNRSGAHEWQYPFCTSIFEPFEDRSSNIQILNVHPAFSYPLFYQVLSANTQNAAHRHSSNAWFE